MFNTLNKINARPEPFEYYTAPELWTNEHTSKKMLEYHLHEKIDAASRNPVFIERSVNWISTKFDIAKGTKIADFGCGPGLYATKLAELGANVTGIDFSENSLTYARRVADQKGLSINYVLGNYLEFKSTDRFDLIIMIMCDYCALSPEQRAKLLSIFDAHLKPDGSILLDVYSLNSFEARKENAIYEKNQLDGFWSKNDYYCFVNTYKYNEIKLILDKYTIIEKSQTREVYNWQQCFSKDALTAEFENNGLAIKEFFSGVSGTPLDSDSKEMAIIAIKA